MSKITISLIGHTPGNSRDAHGHRVEGHAVLHVGVCGGRAGHHRRDHLLSVQGQLGGGHGHVEAGDGLLAAVHIRPLRLVHLSVAEQVLLMFLVNKQKLKYVCVCMYMKQTVPRSRQDRLLPDDVRGQHLIHLPYLCGAGVRRRAADGADLT